MAHPTTTLHDTPIGQFVGALQDADRNVWIFGFTADGDRALVVDADNDVAAVASVLSVSSLGRWECSKRHLDAHTGFYVERFPRRD